MPSPSQVLRKRTPSTSTRSNSSKSKATRGPPRSISAFTSSTCSDRNAPHSRIRAPRLPEVRSIFRVMSLWSEAHSYECNDWAIHNSLHGHDLGVPPILNFEEFLFGEENAVD